MQLGTDRGATLQNIDSVVKSFFKATGPGQAAATQAQKLEFPAFAFNPDDKLILLQGDIYDVCMYIYKYLYM